MNCTAPQVRSALRQVATISIAAMSLHAGCVAAAYVGPQFPAPGGTIFSASGGVAGAPGGRNFNYSNFNTSAFSTLYWGPSSQNRPTASLDGTPDSLAFSGISGQTATWTGATSWINPDTNSLFSNVPARLRITVSGLGATPWITSASLVGFDPGVGTGIGAVVNNSAGSNFTANVAFDAAPFGFYAAINTIEQRPSGGPYTTSSFAGGFYAEPAAVPLPTAAWLFASGMLGVGAIGRMGRKTRPSVPRA